MASKVVVLNSDTHYEEEINRCKPTQLIVVDFFATWCGPCVAIAPKFAELSCRYLNVKFVKVDVDKCQRTAALNGIQAMPTFLFFKNKDKVDMVRGADPTKLESTIIKHMGSSFELEPEEKNVLLGRSFPCFNDLLKNPKEVFDSAASLLLRFANNILRDPQNLKYRQIKLGNEIFMNKLMPVTGTVECLFAMGFEEMDDRLLLPPSSSLDNLHAIRDALFVETSKGKEPGKNMSSKSCTTPSYSVAARRQLQYKPSLNSNEQAKFFASFKSSSSQVLLYEEEELQEIARSKIPIKELEDQAKEDSKKTEDKDGNIGVSQKDCFLMLLLKWFKNDFFTWMNSPPCTLCNTPTRSVGTSEPDLEEQKWGAGTVECYQCQQCYKNIRFPRYNHPQKLLETRTGRCGEWANCFTLCCRAVGFNCRYVLDWTDHVWTEVYSEHQKRWLHCDSCENICDKPLIYEAGWGKKLFYIVAFSKDQVIDVTWRYSSKHTELLTRRNLVTEAWLFNLCEKFTEELQYGLPEIEKKLLVSRTIAESAEFITPKQHASSDEKGGRVSGSLAWRELRGETTTSNSKSTAFKFEASQENVENKRIRVRYNSCKDCYYTTFHDDPSSEQPGIEGWQNGVENYENIFRKVEHDWKTVYLTRTVGSESGSITWSIDVNKSHLKIHNINIILSSKLYEDGKITLKLCSDSECQMFKKDENNISTDKFSGTTSVKLTATLSGGKGDVAWQHAQLFRCSETELDFIGLEIDVSLQE